MKRLLFFLTMLCAVLPLEARHKNFKVSVYVRAYEVENFNDTPVDVKLVGAESFAGLEDLESGEKIASVKEARVPYRRRNPAAKAAFSLKPHSYRAFRYE